MYNLNFPQDKDNRLKKNSFILDYCAALCTYEQSENCTFLFVEKPMNINEINTRDIFLRKLSYVIRLAIQLNIMLKHTQKNYICEEK